MDEIGRAIIRDLETEIATLLTLILTSLPCIVAPNIPLSITVLLGSGERSS